ncbi:hypothetical protein PPYR_00077 [Photinus pyralis]|uniref:Uncharacterized protein n=1 Tax=Photinus pyralis TaxID=7054 RepID=A0A5N4B0I3_PHOPY|nr:hypothetical protein PPYR_00077 [Photinus pyralis]
MQPLDVSFFAPMKRKWREILDLWRKECRRKGSIPKEHFPSIVNRLWFHIENTSATNLQSGFRATGLSPFNPEKVLAKIPGAKPDSERVLDSSFLEFLQEARGYSKEPTNSLKRENKCLQDQASRCKDQLKQHSNPFRLTNGFTKNFC